MSQTQITFSFATPAEAAAFLAKLGAGNASTAASTPALAAPSQPSVAAAAVAAPVQSATTSAPVATPTAPVAPVAPVAQPSGEIDFQRDVVEGALKPYASKVDQATFAKLMQHCGVQRVPELQAKPELWAKIIAHCKNA